MRFVLPVAVAAAAAVAGCLAGCTGGSPQASAAAPRAAASGASPAVSPVAWHSCGGQGSVQCASLQVPLDYRHPGGRKITLALSRVPATAPADRRQGVLLVNPGGPGAPGLDWAPYVAQGLHPSVASEYDIIGFDTRGVGASVPALHCDPSFFATARPGQNPLL